jgi:hypothetical protein
MAIGSKRRSAINKKEAANAPSLYHNPYSNHLFLL